MVGKAFLNLKGAEWRDLSDGRLETGNQCCVVHLGIIMIPMALPLISFDMTAPARLKGQNEYIL